ncbi:MAG: hypothetical protein R3C19_17650 [Planctomycetaceae bacterium]
MSESSAASSKPRLSRWTPRRIVWLVSALGIAAPLLRFLWIMYGPLPAIEISPETTWVTEPLTNDGYVDYLEILRQETAGDPRPCRQSKIHGM